MLRRVSPLRTGKARMLTAARGANRPFWAVIPAGGSGTRLWPLSRPARPKFLLPLLGERSLLQETVARLEGLAPIERTLVICGPLHVDAIQAQLPGLPPENIIVEPVPRGSGSAIGLAAALIRERDPDAIMGSFAADHRIEDVAAFQRAIRTAITAADRGWLVTVGLTPTAPETGFGYIERGDERIIETVDGVAYRAVRFHEKPAREQAEAYLASGRFLWNASMFVWGVGRVLDEMHVLLPALHDGVTRIAAAWDSAGRDEVFLPAWSALDDVTIDHGVMERSGAVAVVPAEMGWSDVGDWNSLGEFAPDAGDGNRAHGDLLAVDAHGNLAWSETGRTIALLGVSDLVVVDTGDVVLVLPRERAQDVKRLVERAKERGGPA